MPILYTPLHRKQTDRVNEMAGYGLDEARRAVLGLLFVVAFGWMAAQILPGNDGEHGDHRWQQVAAAGYVIPPQP
jgi:hypothetical protein